MRGSETILLLVAVALVLNGCDGVNYYGSNYSYLQLFGQRSFGQTQRRETSPFKGDHACGVVVDLSTTPNKVYVADCGNNR
jgi:hypothetical protein